MGRQRVSARWPRYKAGLVVLDDRQPPTLRHVVGSRIYLRRSYVEERLRLARLAYMGAGDCEHRRPRETCEECVRRHPEASHLHVVPVEGPNSVFRSVDFVDVDGCMVGANGYISLMAWGTP